MFNIGMSEMLVIAVVALMIFGPNELPEMLKKLGKGMREIRRASDDLKATVSLSLEDNERNKRHHRTRRRRQRAARGHDRRRTRGRCRRDGNGRTRRADARQNAGAHRWMSASTRCLNISRTCAGG
jgi:Tat protein translocase TatB subunit